MNNQPLISVIVPVFNGSKFLNACLDALFASDFAPFEVIVVDDGSTDNSVEISRAKGAVLMSTSQPQSGPAAARNLAAPEANGTILLFVDADVVVKHDTLSKIAAVFEKDLEISALFGTYDDEPSEQNFLSQYRNLLHHFVHQHSNPEASTFWAGLGAIRKDVFLSVGGFDCEKFKVPSIEDIELGTRLRSNGHRILLAKDIQGKHLKNWTAKSILKTDIFCRAIPWSKLILTSQGLINDMNLKTSDRVSAILVGLTVVLLPFTFWKPWLLFFIAAFLLLLLYFNRRIFRFFALKKGILFAVMAFPWQLLYFFYSGVSFVFCWLRYALPQFVGFGKRDTTHGIRHIKIGE